MHAEYEDDRRVETLNQMITVSMVCIQQGKSYPFKGSFPPMWNPLVFLDFNNLFRTMDEMGQEVEKGSFLIDFTLALCPI